MRIPVDPGDLPLDTVPMDESIVYTGILRKVTPSDHQDKNGLDFLKVVIEVTEPEQFAGRFVADNYLPIQPEITPTMTKTERIKIQSIPNIEKLGRLCSAFKIKGRDTDEWPGATGKFIVEMSEFPKGSGRMRPGINDYVV